MIATVADYVTLAAFVVTGFTAVKVFFINRDVKNLSNRYLLKIRLQEQLDVLQKNADELVTHSSVSEDNSSEIRRIVADVYAICGNLARKTQGLDGVQLLGLHDVIRSCQNIQTKRHSPGMIRIPLDKPIMLSGDDVSALHGDLMLLIQSMRETKKDMEEVVT